MGIDFCFFVDHGFSPKELRTLPELLNKGFMHPVEMEEWRDRSSIWEWERDSLYRSLDEEIVKAGNISFKGQGGFSGSALRHSLEFGHLIRWGTFLSESKIREALRTCALQIAELVGAEHIIYAPDSGFASSLFYDELLNKDGFEAAMSALTVRIGAAPIEELDDLERYFEYDDGDLENVWFYEPAKTTHPQ